YLDVAFGWRSVFWLLTGLGAVLIVGVLALLPETLPPGGRSPLRLGATFATYRDLVRNPGFAYPAVALIAMFGLLFSYIGGSSYVYQGAFGLTPSAFGLAFGACGVAMMFATLAVHRLAARFGSVRLALAGGTIALAGSLGAAVLVVANAPFAGFLAAIVAVAFGIGLTEPALMGRAMAAPKRGTGQAAALLGSAQFLLGAAATAIAGIVAAQGALPWTLLLALFAAVVLALTWAGARGARATPANGEIPSPRAR
ncbi:MAG TPA: MFS transporter, partial [Propioniciclava sp.]|uniref:MFS transporter n=2 Tax=Propioniciclava sp. TaxID=2038686 RepID=UPI002C6EF4B4